MRERPILFSGNMVRANRAGRKTQTRRLVALREFGPSITRGYDWTFRDKRMLWNDVNNEWLLARCPYGMPGDRLWVRETWTSAYSKGCWGTLFAADGAFVQGARAHGKGPHFNADDLPPVTWRPSIFMPRWACRNVYEITDVRVQRLQDISEEDAKAEGALFALDEEQTVLHPELTEQRNAGCCACRGEPNGIAELCHEGLRGKGRPFACWYATLWDSINKDRGPWASNPWVFAISYRGLT